MFDNTIFKSIILYSIKHTYFKGKRNRGIIHQSSVMNLLLGFRWLILKQITFILMLLVLCITQINRSIHSLNQIMFILMMALNSWIPRLLVSMKMEELLINTGDDYDFTTEEDLLLINSRKPSSSSHHYYNQKKRKQPK